MGHRQADLKIVQLGWVPATVAAQIKGGAFASQSTRDAALRSQMQVAPVGRRVVAEASLNGEAAFLVPDGEDPESGFVQKYPLAPTNELSQGFRTMARQRVCLTPGYGLKVCGIFAPSGPVQFSDEGGEWHEDSPGAWLLITVQWDTGEDAPVTTTYKYTPKFSKLPFKALPTGAGAVWDVLEPMDADIPSPTPAQGIYTEHVIATVTIDAYGGLRPVDVCVYESPRTAHHDDEHREGTLSFFPATPNLPQVYAVVGRSAAYPLDQGSQQANKTTHDQRMVWGPRLLQFTAWSESAAVTATEGAPLTTTSTTDVGLQSAVTSYSATHPGWSTSCGGYAMNLEQAGPLELRGKAGAIPMLLRVYAKVTGGTGTVTFKSADYSIGELAVTGTSYAWVEGVAWMKCGTNPADHVPVEAFLRISSGAQTLSVLYLSAEFGRGYIPEE